MAKKKDSILNTLVLFPWWVSVLLSIISYLILKYFISSIDIQRNGQFDITYVFLKGVANAAPMIAPILSIFLLIPAVMSAMVSWRKRNTLSSNFSQALSASRKHTFNPTARITEFSNSNSFTDEIDRNPAINNDKLESNKPIILQGKTIESETRKNRIYLSIETIKKIEWYSFELFCKLCYECMGYRVTKTRAGADGGIDLLLYINESDVPHALVQCKSRSQKDIGVNYIRELLGVMTSYKVDNGIIITNSSFTKEAFEFANLHQIEPIDVSRLWMMIDEFDADKKSQLIDFLESCDFITPTCPNCDELVKSRFE